MAFRFSEKNKKRDMKPTKHCLTTQREVKSKSGFQENHQKISQFKFYSQRIPATYSWLVSILTCADACKDNCAPKALCFISGYIFRNSVVISD